MNSNRTGQGMASSVPSRTRERRNWRSLPWHIAVPALASLLIGLWGIDHVGLWGDERETLLALPNLLWRQWEAPLLPYYTSMWLWTFGGALVSDVWLRLASVVAMAAAVGLAAATSGRLTSRRAALVAGMALALMPSIARYAQEVRVYAFATLLVALATWILVRACQGNTRWWWVGYAISLASIGILAPFAYAVVPAHAVVVLWDKAMRPSLRPWLIATATNIPVVIGAAWLAANYGALHDWLAAPEAAQFVRDLPTMALSPAFGVALFVLAVTTRKGIRWAAAVVVGMAALWLISQGPAPFWVQRSFVPLAPLLAVAAAFAAARLPWTRIAAVIAVLGLVAWPTLQADREPGARGLDPRAFAAVVDREGQPGDVINTAINDWFSWGVARYSARPDDYTYAPSSTGRAWVLDSGVACDRLAEYVVPDSGVLVLCASLPEGWENRVVRETPAPS